MQNSLPATFSPVNAPRAFEHVCDQIRKHLSTGALKPGDKLPPERELAVHLGVSRSVLREALRSLEIAGLIVLKKGGTGGAFISERNWRFLSQAFADMVSVGTISFSELTEARTLIMIDAIKLGCERATEEDFAAMEANIDLTEHYTINEEFEKRRIAATDFYHLVALSAKNQVLAISVDTMTTTLRQFLTSPPTGRPMSTVVESRRRFMKHFRARDAAKASHEMTTYLAGMHQYMVMALAQLGSDDEAKRISPTPSKKRSSAQNTSEAVKRRKSKIG